MIVTGSHVFPLGCYGGFQSRLKKEEGGSHEATGVVDSRLVGCPVACRLRVDNRGDGGFGFGLGHARRGGCSDEDAKAGQGDEDAEAGQGDRDPEGDGDAEAADGNPQEPPTPTPIPPTPTPLPEPKAYSGSGSDVVAIEKPGGLDAVVIVHVVGNAESSYFGVTGFDEAGKQTDLLVNTTDPYDGITLLDARKGQTTTRLQVEAQGDWTIEVRPLAMARGAAVPGTTSGAGDDVLLLDGEPDTAHIVGNAEGRYFGVIGHGKRYDLLVNTTDPYDGRVIVNRDTVVIEVKATGEWEVTFE